MARILVLGGTGYIGGRLVPRLVEQGHSVRCLARDRRKVEGKTWTSVETVQGDVLNPASVAEALKGIEVLYYLVHSMAGSEDEFEHRDRTAAQTVAAAAAQSGVRRIIYLGGLGRRSDAQSPHLRSRHEVGDILRSSGVPVTEFRAGVVVGSGSASFEMIHHLVNRLPVMICPRWLVIKTQPIAIGDVIRYLLRALDTPASAGRILDIGGPEILTYREMMRTVADVLKLRRILIQVPVLTPRLSSYWVNLVTPIPSTLARALIESVRHETVCEHDDARRMFDVEPMTFRQAVERALNRVRSHTVETRWTEASRSEQNGEIDPSHLKVGRYQVAISASAHRVFEVVSRIGGDTGWYYANWLWRIRGFIDQQLGGVGLRRGRRHPTKITVGEALDFWRVEEVRQDALLKLRAEMIVWGKAWLEFKIEPEGDHRCCLTLTASYYPSGVRGFAYWYSVLPVHGFVFRGLVKSIARRAVATSPSEIS